jgi:nucleotide-binding universal stress UspA family protein
MPWPVVRISGGASVTPGVDDLRRGAWRLRGTAAKDFEAASRDANVLVVGSRGRGRIRGFLLGSVSRAIHHVTCPVAVVR